jgi:hypothetical protein
MPEALDIPAMSGILVPSALCVSKAFVRRAGKLRAAELDCQAARRG